MTPIEQLRALNINDAALALAEQVVTELQDNRDAWHEVADRTLALLAERTFERDAARAEVERLRRTVGRFQQLRNNVIGTQSASWSNVTYPMVAILQEAGLDYDPPTDVQKLDHKRCYGGAGRMPDPAALAPVEKKETDG